MVSRLCDQVSTSNLTLFWPKAQLTNIFTPHSRLTSQRLERHLLGTGSVKLLASCLNIMTSCTATATYNHIWFCENPCFLLILYLKSRWTPKKMLICLLYNIFYRYRKWLFWNFLKNPNLDSFKIVGPYLWEVMKISLNENFK